MNFDDTNKQQARNIAQQNAARQNAIGSMQGGVGQNIFGERLMNDYEYISGSHTEARREQQRPKPEAYIGKITPKPGVIEDGYHNYRWKTAKDYKWHERIIIWFQT